MTPTSKPSIVGLIPARGGSKRVPGKNIRLLGGKPLIAWTIEAALESGIFSRVYVSSDDEETLRIAGNYDVVAMKRDPTFAADGVADIDWVDDLVERLEPKPEAFAILRPTSPFRTPAAIRSAWAKFQECRDAHSIRAIQPVTEHPGKMWQLRSDRSMWPLVAGKWPALGKGFDRLRQGGSPWHSSPMQGLPIVYVQNASLEIAWTYVLKAFGTISGERVAPFVYPTLDINTEDDWREAERLACQMTLA